MDSAQFGRSVRPTRYASLLKAHAIVRRHAHPAILAVVNFVTELRTEIIWSLLVLTRRWWRLGAGKTTHGLVGAERQ